ncbi:MAG: LysR family transcriptional regulator [Myxococcales bacterium FL481]|nr:MAG: LysR family transcriptional regulator [Myxococcales bacterium FL481]
MPPTIDYDVNDVLAFVHVVAAGSFSAAARELSVPVSSVSRRVARLEDQLGAQLLQRTTRRLRLTDAGQVLFDYGSRVEADMAEAERRVAALQGRAQGRLRVTMPIGTGILTQKVADFAAAYPDILVDVGMTDRCVDLVEEGVDVALRAGVLADSSLIAHKLLETRLRLFASPSYLETRDTPRQVADLADHECIAFEPPSGRGSWTFQLAGKDEKVSVAPRFVTNNLAMVRDAAIAGLGIAWLPDLGLVDDVTEGRLVPLLPDVAASSGAIWVVYPSRRHLAPKVRVFVDYMREHVPPCLRAMSGAGGVSSSP